MYRCVRVLVAGALMATAACETVEPSGQTAAILAGPATGANFAEIPLAPGDKLRVTIYGEDKLSGEYQIDPSGSLSLPLAGSIRAAGLSKTELERLIPRRFPADILRNPRVTVEVVSYRPFYILGEVEKPGEYQPRSGLNVVSALAVAGGPTYRASKSRVLIQRGGVGPFQEYPLEPTVPIYPGDLVRVPERFF